MTGTIFSVNDISGIPSIEVIDTGSVKIAETFGTVAVGANTLSNYKFYVSGNTLLGNTTVNNSLTITNNNRLAFNTLNGNSVYMIQQSDDNFVLYTTTPTGSSRAVFAVYANTNTSNLNIVIPLQISNTVVANSSTGSAGQVLTSSGTGVYWGAAGAGANNASYLQGRTWETAGAIGSTVANTGAFTTLTSSGLTKIGQAVTQAAPSATDILSTAHASISGQGSNYLAFGQYDSTFTQWIQSSFINPTTASYNIALNPLGGNVSIGSATAPTKLYVNGHVTIANGYGLYANGTLGTAGFVLTSNGTSLYWANSAATNVANAAFATTANNSLFSNSASFVYGKQESQLYVANSANSSALQGATWQAPLGIGTVTANTGAFTTLITTGNTVFSNSTIHSGNSIFYANATFNSNAVFNGGVVANGSLGTSGFVLVSNGTSAYWASANIISGTAASANNASYLNGFNSAYYTNATNISTGTLAEPRLPYRMDQNVRTTDNVTFANLTITGSVLVTGNVTTWSSNNLSITDNMIYLNSNSTIANPDIGFAANYNDGIYRHTGFFRDATDGVWKVFDQYLPEPNASAYIDTANASFRIADFQANVVTMASANVGGALLTSTNYGGTANNASYLAGRTWATPFAIGATVANTGAFTSLSATGDLSISSTFPRIYLTDTDGSSQLSIMNNNGRFSVYDDTNTTHRLVITLSGNVAIGSLSAETKLFVNGHMSVANGFGIYANGTLGANGLVLTSNGTSLYWGSVSTSAGGFTGNTVSANATIVKNQSYYVNAAAGWVNMTMPSSIATGDIFIVHSQTGNTRILNNSINIMDVGSGNDLVLESGQTVWVQAVNTSSVGVMFTYPAGGASTLVANAIFSTTANNSTYLQARTWETAGAIGASVANTGTFTTLSASANSSFNGNVYFSTSTFAITPTFKAYREAVGANTVSTAASTIDLSTFNIFNLSMTSSTTVSFTNPPASGIAYSFMLYCKQDAVGSRTISWPATVKWPNNSVPTMSTGANKIDVFSFFTLDGGTTYLGALSLANTG